LLFAYHLVYIRPMNINKFKNWLISATADEIRKLADVAGTSVPYLHHVAMGRRNMSPQLAGKVEEGVLMLRMARRSLPSLTRGDLCATCSECPYFKECVEDK
jgi:hypothetical protein